MKYTSTQVVNNYQKKTKECDMCTSIEVLKNQSCDSSCLGDTKYEQLLIAQRLIKTLKQPFDIILEKGLDFKHINFSQRIESVETKIPKFKLPELNNSIQEFLSLSEAECKSVASHKKPADITERLSKLDNTLTQLEFNLSLKAAEHYDNFDTAYTIPLENTEEEPAIKLYQDDLTDQFNLLEKLAKLNNAHQNAIENLKDSSAFELKVVEFQREFDEFREKHDSIDNQIKKIQEMQEVLYKKIQNHYDSLNEIKNNLEKISQKQKSLPVSKATSLINITDKIFNGHRFLKQQQTLTKSFLSSHLKLFQTIPQLKSLKSFTTELSRLM